MLITNKTIQILNIIGQYQNTSPQNEQHINNSTPNSIDEDELLRIYEEKLKHDEQIQQQYKQAQQQAEAQLKYEREYNQKMNNAVNKAYHDAYIQDLKNRGYKIRYKKTFKDYLTGFISIIITLFVFYLLWNIPFIQNFLINLYEENAILRAIVDVFLDIFRK